MSRIHLTILIMLWLVIHVLLFWHYGIRNLLDSGEYITRADYIIQNHKLEDLRHIFYAIPLILITLFRWIFPLPIIPYLIFQCTLSVLATLALYASGKKIFNNALSGLFASVLFLLWWENRQWDIALMTESLQCSFTCFLIYRLSFFKEKLKDYLIIIILLIVILLTRPTGVVIVAGAIVFFLVQYWPRIINKPFYKYSIICSLLIIGYLGAYFMFTHWDFTEQYTKGNIVTYFDSIDESHPFYSADLRVDTNGVKFADSDKPPLDKIIYFIIHNPFYFLKTAGLKVWFLLTAYRPYYSLVHNVYSITWLAFIYVMYYFGYKNTQHAPIKVFTFIIIIFNCALIAISTVDWDNRFYIPMEPGIVLMAGGGIVYCMNFLKNKFNINKADNC